MDPKKPLPGAGHAAHSLQAENQSGLSGAVERPLNIVFLGAGSMFCPRLCADVLAIPNLAGGQFRLVDVDEERLGMMHRVIERLIEQSGVSGWAVVSSTDRRALLPGADYAVCCVEVAGLACVEMDNDIPLKYGVDQCIGDTMGPGGLFKGLRTVPVYLDILRDMRELCPDCLMLNYTNPMSMMCLAAGRAVPEVKTVGLCHSVQGTSRQLAEWAGVPYGELAFQCAGINHLAWFTELKHWGECLYERVLTERFVREVNHGLQEYAEGKARMDAYDIHDNPEKITRPYEQEDLVRKDMCLRFGAFITESSGHLSEYLPYYRGTDAGKAYLRLGYHGGSRFYASNWPTWRRQTDAQRQRLVEGAEAFDLARSFEYASWIIEAIEKDAPLEIYGNVMNESPSGATPCPEGPGVSSHRLASGTARPSGQAVAPDPRNADREATGGLLIDNLPGPSSGGGCVEVKCLVDGGGVQPVPFGKLPAQMAHVCASNMAFFDLAATAAIDKSKEAAIHALMLDPLCQAVLAPREIKAMALEMFEVEAEYLPGFK